MNVKHLVVLSIAGVLMWALALPCAGAEGKNARSGAAAKKTSVTVELDESNSSKTVTVPMDRAIVVRLKSNATTGYGWKVSECDDTALKLAGNPAYEAPDTHLVGAGGHEVFTFEPLKAGETTVTLVYVRPWEKDTPPVQTWSAKIKVMPKK